MPPKKNDEYKIGYRHPPKDTQFKPGQSGNPEGRRKGSKNLETDLKEEFGEKLTVQENGRTVKISKQRLLIKSKMNRALKGSDRAGDSLLTLYLRVVGIGDDAKNGQFELTPEEKEVLKNLEARLKGKTEPEEGTS